MTASPPIVFLHGIPDTGRAWDGVRVALEPTYACRAPDLPGFGGTPAPTRLQTLADVRTAVDALVAGVPEPLALVVHDVGGLFGLAWAVAQPERLAALVILNSSVFPERRWYWGARLLRTPVVGELAMALSNLPAFRREIRRASNQGRDDTEIARSFAAFDAQARAMALALYRLQTPALLGELADQVRALTSDVPSLVIWGDRDPYLPVSFAERYEARETIHHTELGHWPHLEASTQIAAEIRAFLQAPDGAGFVP